LARRLNAVVWRFTAGTRLGSGGPFSIFNLAPELVGLSGSLCLITLERLELIVGFRAGADTFLPPNQLAYFAQIATNAALFGFDIGPPIIFQQQIEQLLQFALQRTLVADSRGKPFCFKQLDGFFESQSEIVLTTKRNRFSQTPRPLRIGPSRKFRQPGGHHLQAFVTIGQQRLSDRKILGRGRFLSGRRFLGRGRPTSGNQAGDANEQQFLKLPESYCLGHIHDYDFLTRFPADSLFEQTPQIDFAEFLGLLVQSVLF
jgi:hypothetical protein